MDVPAGEKQCSPSVNVSGGYASFGQSVFMLPGMALRIHRKASLDGGTYVLLPVKMTTRSFSTALSLTVQADPPRDTSPVSRHTSQ